MGSGTKLASLYSDPFELPFSSICSAVRPWGNLGPLLSQDRLTMDLPAGLPSRCRPWPRWQVGPLLLAILLLPALAWPDERSTARRFEEARQDEPSLIAFLRAMPKGGDL